MKKYFPRLHKTILERFHSHISSKNGCWAWRNPNNGTGYGEFWWARKRYLAHRFSYEHFVGPIPDGMQIDHLCRNRACVNPYHLRVMTLQENVLSGIGITAVNKKKTHCLRGHEFTETNTYFASNGHRGCRICRDKSSRESQKKPKPSTFPCVVCGKDFVWRGHPQPKTCSRSCAVKLSHSTCPRRPPVKERARCFICGEPANAKNLCGKHYMQDKRSEEVRI